jgi:peroxiredoxin
MPARTHTLLSVAVLAALSLATARPARAEGRDWTGMAAPDLEVPQGVNGLASGTSLRSLRGTVVVVKFFFTECPTCRASLPEFDALARAYGARGVQFIGVAYDDVGTLQAFMRNNGYSFPVAVDPTGSIPRRWGVETYPTNYLVGADGVVKAYNDLSSARLERELEVAASWARRERNVRELGAVPPALRAAVDAAAENDYGQVARVVKDHHDATKDGAAVVEAAARIEKIVEQRWSNRVERIRRRIEGGDRAGGAVDVQRLMADFHDTAFVEMTRAAFGSAVASTASGTAASVATPPAR